MRFWEWANARDHGVLQRVANASGICYPQVHAYYSERRTPDGVNAMRLLKALRKLDGAGCEVSLEELITPRKGALPAKRTSKRAATAAKRARAVRGRAKRRASASEARA